MEKGNNYRFLLQDLKGCLNNRKLKFNTKGKNSDNGNNRGHVIIDKKSSY